MQIPNLDYPKAFVTYTALSNTLASPVPFWWAGGSLLATLCRVRDPEAEPWKVRDFDIGVREADYAAMCAHLRSKGAVCTLESEGDGKIPSRINQGASSVWQVVGAPHHGVTPHLPTIDVMAFPAASDTGFTAPVEDWLGMMDLNVCQVLVGPGMDGICLHADGTTLRDIAAGRIQVVNHHPTTQERLEKYQRRLAGGVR